MGFAVGIDVGGTFTDAVVIDATGNVAVFKTPTVPADPTVGLLDCLRRGAAHYRLSLGGFLEQVEKLTYGTTIATNLLVEGKGARAGLITTKGFRDTLPIARIGREYLGLDLQCERPPSLIPRHLIEEVSERVDASGTIVTPLDGEELARCLQRLLHQGVEAVAVCLLWSFKNAVHEEMIAQDLSAAAPELHVSLSSRIAPILGEYERTATVAMNAMLAPRISAHLKGLEERLEGEGLRAPVLLMQSTGGVTPAPDAAQRPVTLLNSGPAGGVIASKHLCELLGLSNALCVDMGGTTFDASLITAGQYATSLPSRALGHSLLVPMIDITSLGAGGGSIAWLDGGQRLKVGPQSAGADPGPACYGKGGTEPTVTDADLLLGRLNPDYFLGGEIALDPARAETAVGERIATLLGMSLLEAAYGIVEIADATMASALRRITVQRGHDPRDYTMVAFGGAGPTHAAVLARELGICRILVPSLATVLSAYGIVASDIMHTFSRTEVMEIEAPQRLEAVFASLEEQGHALLEREGIAAAERVILRYAELRYKGQAHQVTVTVPSKGLTAADLGRLISDFEAAYMALYGKDTAYREAGCEVVTLRVEAVGRTLRPSLRAAPQEGTDASPALKGRRNVTFGRRDGAVATPIYDGARLMAGNLFRGPAIVEYPGTTAVVYPGQRAQVDPYLNLLIEEEA